jgi:hypothetical protein
MERRKDASPATGDPLTEFHPCKANCSDAETSAFIRSQCIHIMLRVLVLLGAMEIRWRFWIRSLESVV